MSKSNLSSRNERNNTKNIYLDYASGVSANPSSIHKEGMKAKIELQNARKEVATILNSQKEEIIFTSGGTESNNIAIQGLVLALQEKKLEKIFNKKLPHIITTNIEHPSVLETCKILQKRKLAEISIVSVEKNGIINPKKIRKEIKENTVLVSVMYANNEIGVIQPIREIAKMIRRYKKNKKNKNQISSKISLPFFHTDAMQAVNYLNLNVEKLGVDLLSLSGSKIERAGRVGVLFKKKSAPLATIFGGGNQEFGLRPGTENLPEILKFSHALKLAQKNKEKEKIRLKKLQDYFIKKLLKLNSNFNDNTKKKTIAKNLVNHKMILNGDLKDRLPNNINVTFPKIPSDLLVIELSTKGIMVSSKSACKSSEKESSYVIRAINPKSDSEIGGLRFSFGSQTTKSDIDYTIKILNKVLIKLKKWYNDA